MDLEGVGFGDDIIPLGECPNFKHIFENECCYSRGLYGNKLLPVLPIREKEVCLRGRFQSSSVTRTQEGSSVGKSGGPRARVLRLRAAVIIPDAESTHRGTEGS